MRTSTSMARPPDPLELGFLEEAQELYLELGLISPISSRKTVPLWASSIRPRLSFEAAPVNRLFHVRKALSKTPRESRRN